MMETTTEYWMSLNVRPDVKMVRGAGSYLWDHRGRRYLDFIQGWAVNCLGHCPKVVTDAVVQQLAQVMNVGPAHYNEPALLLTERLARLSGLEQVFLANSGVEANEAAVKLCRKWGQRHRHGAYEVITAHDGFHGRTLAMTSATGKPGWEDAFPPKIAGFPKCAYGDIDAIEALISERTVAVMVEPIQGESGAVTPPVGYLRELRDLCSRRGILLVLDEVQTGLARTGPLFAFQAAGITPDIVTLGKGLGGGLPISALLAKREVACFEHGDHGSTFGGNAVTSRAALAVLDELERPEAAAARAACSSELETALQGLAREVGATVRGRGHLFGVVLPFDGAAQLRDRAFEAGLLINAARPNVLRFMPALNVSPAEVAEMRQILAPCLLREAERATLARSA
jgi:acetylornithine/N-succinyldiaminopimelate aminotransferase